MKEQILIDALLEIRRLNGNNETSNLANEALSQYEASKEVKPEVLAFNDYSNPELTSLVLSKMKDYIILSNIPPDMRKEISPEWLFVWGEIEKWYGDPKKEESAERLLARLQANCTLTFPFQPPIEHKQPEAKGLISLERAGIVAVEISDLSEPTLTASEQSFFVAGFIECIKYLSSLPSPKVEIKEDLETVTKNYLDAIPVIRPKLSEILEDLYRENIDYVECEKQITLLFSELLSLNSGVKEKAIGFLNFSLTSEYRLNPHCKENRWRTLAEINSNKPLLTDGITTEELYTEYLKTV